MPEYTHQYMRSLCDPSTVKGAGIPVVPSLPSQKFDVFCKGALSTGLGGRGYIVVAPWKAGVNDINTAGSEGTFLTFTTAASTSTALSDQATDAGNDSQTLSNSPYSKLNVGVGADDLQMRLVSAELKVTYASTLLDRGGNYTMVQHPQHDDLYTYTEAQLLGLKTVKRIAIDDKECRVLFCPGIWTGYISSFGGGEPFNSFMAIFIDSKPGNNFTWEFNANFEVTGRNVRGTTPSYADAAGFAAIQSAMASTMGVSNKTPVETIQQMTKTVAEAMSASETRVGSLATLARDILPIAVKAAPMILGAL